MNLAKIFVTFVLAAAVQVVLSEYAEDDARSSDLSK
jgi:hypothetical protein